MALQRPHADDPPIHYPTFEEGMAILDAEARRSVGISAEEFLRRYDAGEYDGIEEDAVGRALMRLEFFIPFARPSRIDQHGRVLPEE